MTLKLNGSSSGYTAIDAPASAGSNTLVLPADNGSNGEFLQTNGSGTLDWAAAGGGKILQVVSANNSTQTQYTNTSFATTGFTINITPSATSSKILLTTGLSLYKSATGTSVFLTYYKDSTNLGNATYGMGEFSQLGGAGGQFAHVQLVDSPNTTSQVTYALYVRVNSGDVYIQSNNVGGNITAMEIGA